MSKKETLHIYCRCSTKQQIENSGVVAFALLPLRSGSKGIIGYISCQWCKWDKVDNLDFAIASKVLEDARNAIEVHLVQQITSKSRR